MAEPDAGELASFGQKLRITLVVRSIALLLAAGAYTSCKPHEENSGKRQDVAASSEESAGGLSRPEAILTDTVAIRELVVAAYDRKKEVCVWNDQLPAWDSVMKNAAHDPYATSSVRSHTMKQQYVAHMAGSPGLPAALRLEVPAVPYTDLYNQTIPIYEAGRGIHIRVQVPVPVYLSTQEGTQTIISNLNSELFIRDGTGKVSTLSRSYGGWMLELYYEIPVERARALRLAEQDQEVTVKINATLHPLSVERGQFDAEGHYNVWPCVAPPLMANLELVEIAVGQSTIVEFTPEARDDYNKASQKATLEAMKALGR